MPPRRRMRGPSDASMRGIFGPAEYSRLAGNANWAFSRANNARISSRNRTLRTGGMIAAATGAAAAAYRYFRRGKGRAVAPRRIRNSTRVPNNRLKKVEQKLRNMESELTYRTIDATPLKPAQNVVEYGDYIANDVNQIEAALANLRYYDPSNPGTLITASGATGTFSRFYKVKTYMKITIRCNYQVPCLINVYKYAVKTDTSIPPTTALTNGLADVGNPSATSTVVYPSDSSQLGDLWRLIESKKMLLKPGQEVSFAISFPEITYDPSIYDSQAIAYQKRNHCCAFLVRAQGVPSHDSSTSTQYGISGAGVDILQKKVLKITYDSGGPSIETIVVSDSLDTQTASAVVSQPVVDNQAYSIA